MSEAKRFWATAADWWIEADTAYKRGGINKPSENYMDKEVKGFRSILEIGAGTGRLIGLLSQRADCHSVDINPELCKLVKTKYPSVTTHNTPADNLSELKDNSIDLVYSFQCLQHIPPEEIHQTLKEIFRVAKKEVWLVEGFVPNKSEGERTHKANGGSYVYYYDRLFRCYRVDDVQNGKILAYRMRKADNA